MGYSLFSSALSRLDTSKSVRDTAVWPFAMLFLFYKLPPLCGTASPCGLLMPIVSSLWLRGLVLFNAPLTKIRLYNNPSVYYNLRTINLLQASRNILEFASSIKRKAGGKTGRYRAVGNWKTIVTWYGSVRHPVPPGILKNRCEKFGSLRKPLRCRSVWRLQISSGLLWPTK